MWKNDNGLVCLLISIIETTSISITCITIPFDPLFKVISEGSKISLEKKDKRKLWTDNCIYSKYVDNTS